MQGPADFLALIQDLEEYGAVDPTRAAAGFELASGESVEIEVVADDDWVEFRAPDPLPPLEGEKGERKRMCFADIEGNRIHAGIENLDDRMTPARGLRRLDPAGNLIPLREKVSGRTLLIVHGTFSKAESLIEGLGAEDPALLQRMHAVYDQIVTFDYPTLSQQAVASAITLSHLMGEQVPGSVDVISHSQGGLVVRFWLELFDPRRLAKTRAVFVAGTLAGTNLAAPHCLRSALDYLGNLARVVKIGSSALTPGIPAFGLVGKLAAIFHKSLNFLSDAPITDAGVALVPGFQGMSRVGNQAEIRGLRESLAEVPGGYFAVTGAFAPVGPRWKFWENWQTRGAKLGMDLIFPGPHDLVVDTESMTSLSDTLRIPAPRTHEFQAGQQHVHHTNYFKQPATRAHIHSALGLG